MLEIFAFICINFVAMVAPGPDFAIVTRYGLTGSRKSAFFATLGITFALLIHVTYCLLGVAVFFQSYPKMFFALQATGALYVGYIGYQLGWRQTSTELVASTQILQQAFRRGFLCNLLNPKATLFLLSLFAQFVSQSTSWNMKLVYGAIIPISALAWFGFLSYILTHPTCYAKIAGYQMRFTRWTGFLLVGLSTLILGKIVWMMIQCV